MAIAFLRSATAAFTTATNLNITFAATASDNDIICVQTIYAGASPTNAGFTEFAASGYASIEYTTGFFLRMHYKRAASESSATYNFTRAGSDWIALQGAEYSGCITSGSPVDIASNNQENSNAPTWLTITTTEANTMTVGCGRQEDGGTLTVPSGASGRQTATGTWWWDQAQAASGASGNRDGSSTATNNCGLHHFALKVAASGATGNIAATLQKATSALTGTHKQTGTIAASLQKSTASLTGVMQPSGIITSTLTKITSSLLGIQTQTGAVISTLQKAISSLTGNVGTGISGVITSSIQKPTASLVGLKTYTGTIVSTLTKSTSSLTGVMLPTGIITSILTKATSSLTGIQTITGSISATLTKTTSSLTGLKTYTGTITSTLKYATSALVGKQTYTGSIVSTLAKTLASLTGAQPYSGTIAATLQRITSALTGAFLEPSYASRSTEILSLPEYSSVVIMPVYSLDIILENAYSVRSL